MSDRELGCLMAIDSTSRGAGSRDPDEYSADPAAPNPEPSAGDAESGGVSSSYFGGKGGSGTYQRLINHIPPHDTLVIPFAGHCAVTRHIRRATRTLLFDTDGDVIGWWRERLEAAALKHATVDRDFSGITVTNCCGIAALRTLTGLMATDSSGGVSRNGVLGRVMVYADPPYPRATLKSASRYQHDLSDAQHEELLRTLNAASWFADVMVSSYWSDLYGELLADWPMFAYRSMTRGGLATEHVWMSYSRPEQLHDYQYLGRDKRERYNFARRRSNLLGKLRSLPAIERNDLLMAIATEFGAAAGTPKLQPQASDP